ncbi:hypothetical protein GE061_006085 [Apolygus lucorum]|uniref:Protein TsetseEP domain-containing protein n=1 Tax=Apolygus lucorum TaxID=248454 RepID=A0A8S9WSY5_APOLU|nr:hypothetical protein GE061_006085 [Apolygus lucorum]
MNTIHLIVGVCFSLLLQVSCNEEQSEPMDFDSLAAGLSEIVQNLNAAIDKLEQNPIHVRSKRAAELDDCHTLQTQGLPGARESIYGAWNKSMDAAVALTASFNDLRNCASWNIFVSERQRTRHPTSWDALTFCSLTALITEIEMNIRSLATLQPGVLLPSA